MGALPTKGADLAEISQRINAEHDAAMRSFASALDHARNAGQLLIDAKAALPHGAWLPWIEQNCKFGERSGRTYMRIAREWPRLESNRQSLADLSISKAIEIIAPPKAAPAQQERIAPPAQAHTVAQAAPQPTPERCAPFTPLANLRREPTPEEIAEHEMQERLSRVIVMHIRDWHAQNRNASVDLICKALRYVVIPRLQDGEVELGA